MKWLWSKCRRFERDLTLLVSGDLEVDARGELQAHLADCPRCRARVKELQAIVAGCHTLVKELPAMETPPSLQQRYTSAIRELASEVTENAPLTSWWTGRRLTWGTVIGLWALSLMLRVTAPQAPKPVVVAKVPSLNEIRMELAVVGPTGGEIGGTKKSQGTIPGTNAGLLPSNKNDRHFVYSPVPGEKEVSL